MDLPMLQQQVVVKSTVSSSSSPPMSWNLAQSHHQYDL
jgi:hypothetical protein